MKLFGQIVRTIVNVVQIPVDVVKDVGTLGGVCTKGRFEPYLKERLEKIKEDSRED